MTENSKLTRSAARYYGQTLNNPSPHFRSLKPVNGTLVIAEPFHGYADGGEGDKFGYINTGADENGKIIWEAYPAREIQAGDSVIYVLPAEDEHGRRVHSFKAMRGIEQNHRTMLKMRKENGRFCDIHGTTPSGLQTFNHWFKPGEEPTKPEFVGQPVDVEADYLIALEMGAQASAENSARLAVLVSDVVLEVSRRSPRDVHFDDIVSLVQEWFLERVQNGSVKPGAFVQTIKTMTGHAIADVKAFVEYATRVGNGEDAKAVDTAYAQLTDEGSTLDGAPSPQAVAKRTAEITRRLDKARIPAESLVEDVIAGRVQNAEISEALEKVQDRLNRKYRFVEAVRVSDDPKETEAAQLKMIVAEVRDEVGRMGSTPTISYDRAYAISNAKAVVSIDHNDGLRTDDEGNSTDKPSEGTIHAHMGNPIRSNTTDLAYYDRLFQAIGMLKKEIHRDLAWYVFGEDEDWTQQELAEKYGKNQSSISRQIQTVVKKVSATLKAMEAGEIEVEYGGGIGDVVLDAERMLQEVPDESDEFRDACRAWLREDAKTDPWSLYRVPASEAFHGTLRDLFEATRKGHVTLREFCGWVQEHGKQAWAFSSAPQMFDQIRREYLDNYPIPGGQTRSEDTEREKAWRAFQGWFRRLR